MLLLGNLSCPSSTTAAPGATFDVGFPSAFFSGTPIDGQITCASSIECTVTDGTTDGKYFGAVPDLDPLVYQFLTHQCGAGSLCEAHYVVAVAQHDTTVVGFPKLILLHISNMRPLLCPTIEDLEK
jgi:hypothetical protein